MGSCEVAGSGMDARVEFTVEVRLTMACQGEETTRSEVFKMASSLPRLAAVKNLETPTLSILSEAERGAGNELRSKIMAKRMLESLG